MPFVTDPDDLDRYQILFDPVAETINIRGLGAERDIATSGIFEGKDGVTVASSGYNFSSAGSDFTSEIVANDIVTIASGPSGVIDYYQVQFVQDANVLTMLRWNDTTSAFDANPTSPQTGLTFKVYTPTPSGGPGGGFVSDGVAVQALYSFSKEEWRTLSNSGMPDLIKFIFPLESITTEQFEIGGTSHSNWDFANNYTRQLLRTGGWDQITSAGLSENKYTGVVTLGSLDSDAQVYYQQHDADTDPADFVLTGAVNQAINVYDLATRADATGSGFLVTNNNTIARKDNGNWETDGYKPGGKITIISSSGAINDGTFTISTVGSGVNGQLVVTGTPLTNISTDLVMEAAVDKRSYLKLFVRKKAKSYAGSEISDIGVTTIDTIVNRFPLAHTDDPAITLDDGQLGGDGTTTGDIFQDTEVHTTNTNGITSVEASDGTFTFTSAGSTFNAGGLRVGDTLDLESGSDIGFYEIKTIDSATQLTCYVEPTSTFTGGESTLTFEVHTGTRDIGGAAGDLDYTAGATTATITDATRAFDADGGLGARIVTVGDMVVVSVTDGETKAIGVYKVTAVATTILTLNATDLQNYVTTSIVSDTVTYVVLRPGMHLQYKSFAATSQSNPNTDLSYSGATIKRNAGMGGGTNWVTDNYVIGGTVVLANAESSANDGTYIITNITTDSNTNDTLTVINTDGTTPSFTAGDGNDTAVSISGTSGFIRSMNSVNYSFNWRLFGNSCTLAQAFQFLQRELRRTIDIDESNSSARGDITNLLMSFSTPTGTTLNLFIDDLTSTDLNNVTKEDLLEIARNFAFIAGVIINLNSNITDSTNAKVTVFFSDPDENAGSPVTGNEFGTDGALIVQDKDSNNMEDTTPLASQLSFEFDFDNNTQGGRDPSADQSAGGTDIVIVAIGTDSTQYVRVTDTIQRQSSNIFSVTGSLERNYSNP
jgi:hypothetical protein